MVHLWLTRPACCCFRVTLGEDLPAQSRSCESQPEQDQDKNFFFFFFKNHNAQKLTTFNTKLVYSFK